MSELTAWTPREDYRLSIEDLAEIVNQAGAANDLADAAKDLLLAHYEMEGMKDELAAKEQQLQEANCEVERQREQREINAKELLREMNHTKELERQLQAAREVIEREITYQRKTLIVYNTHTDELDKALAVLEAQQHTLGVYANVMEPRYNQLLTENESLRTQFTTAKRAIEDAPHAKHCSERALSKYGCDCWKSKAMAELEGE